jgi:hypothetical protein
VKLRGARSETANMHVGCGVLQQDHEPCPAWAESRSVGCFLQLLISKS